VNVFFVSNSTCYYFTDELYGLLTAAGDDDVNLSLVYYSGCSVQRHHLWWKEKKSAYQLRVLDRNGLTVFPDTSLADALATQSWDFISFDNNARSFSSGDTATSLAQAEPWFGELFSEISALHPEAKYLWHQVWANEIGYKMAFSMETHEQRTRVYEAKRGVMKHMMKTYGIGGVPTGDAWEKVRDLPLFTQPLSPFQEVERFSLCSRIGKNGFKDDYTHDGDIGGGQYLNACVWFEILTGKSCVGNPFRPKYLYQGKDVSLSEEKIQILQNAAHEAVSEHRAATL